MQVAAIGTLTHDLGREVARALDARLRRDDPRPVAIALSGGGDSVALLLAAHTWAQSAARPLLVLTVDHGLQSRSPAWTEACRQRAASLGLAFRDLSWTGPKPVRGLPAAARAARHALLAEAAREAGARVILLGHTADDVNEARAMRAAGASTPEPRVWSPSPAWPEGRGVFLLRPMLGLRRADIRAWLAERDESWIEDPANEDLRYARSRARAALLGATPPKEPGERPPLAQLVSAVATDSAGGMSIDRSAVRRAPLDAVARYLAVACVCAGGGARPAAPDRARRLADRVRSQEIFAASLAGARLEAEAGTLSIFREAGERARGGLAPLRLSAGQSGVWDGRFEVWSNREVQITSLAGHAAQLPRGQRSALSAIPAAARPAMPVIEGDPPHCPIVAPLAGVDVRSLVAARLLAACGAVEREPGD